MLLLDIPFSLSSRVRVAPPSVVPRRQWARGLFKALRTTPIIHHAHPLFLALSRPVYSRHQRPPYGTLPCHSRMILLSLSSLVHAVYNDHGRVMGKEHRRSGCAHQHVSLGVHRGPPEHGNKAQVHRLHARALGMYYVGCARLGVSSVREKIRVRQLESPCGTHTRNTYPGNHLVPTQTFYCCRNQIVGSSPRRSEFFLTFFLR